MLAVHAEGHSLKIHKLNTQVVLSLQCLAAESVVPDQKALASSWRLLEMKILRLQPRCTE